MKIIKVTNGKLFENCYIIKDKENAIVIDPGMGTDKILDAIKKEDVKVSSVLLTHGHFDHIFSAKKLKDMGAKIYISESDAPKLLDSELSMGFICNVKVDAVLPDGFLVEGKNEIDGKEFEIVSTPGHTSGSVVIIYKDNIFTGDTYFEDGVYGRTDLLDGSQEQMDTSIAKLKPLLKNKKVWAGHE